MADAYEDGLHFYAGSRLLAPLARMTGLEIDKVNFLACQIFAIGFGHIFRTQLHAGRVSPTTRHLVQLVVGFCITYFCYSYQVWSVVLQTIVCLILMKSLQPGLMEVAVFVVSLGWLCIAHISRQYYDYGGYTLDITGFLMLNTQRMSSMAFSLVDGQKDVSQLSPSLRRQAIRKFPSVLELLGHMFCFTTALCGPFMFFNDYISFIEGREPRREDKLPGLVIEKVAASFLSAVIFQICAPMFPLGHLTEPAFGERGFFSKMGYLVVCTTLMRSRYYFGWKIAEAANHSAGLGFRGYDEQGKEQWDMVDNMNIRQVELCTSLKVVLDNWNITTAWWLRHVVYVRMPFLNTPAVFIVSALWHGFYPGYYFTFISGIIFITASRLVRRNVRAYFQTSSYMRRLYDVITFILTRVTLIYLTFPFMLLELLPVVKVHTHTYWWLHISALATILFFNLLFPAKKLKSEDTQQQAESSTVPSSAAVEKKTS